MNFFTKSRVETFSDGIFAIIVTLLVLEIKVPHVADHDSVRQLATALWGLLPKVVAWMISFLTVCVIWVNHHRIFEAVKTIDQPFFWLNANLLLWVSLLPYPTALMGDYPQNPLAVSTYGAVSLMMGIAFVLIRVYMWKKPEITKALTDPELRRGVRNVVIFGPTPYLIGLVVAWIHPFLAFALYGFVTVYFIFPKSTTIGQIDGTEKE